MSFTKMDPLFPGLNEEITNENLAEIVAYSLQKDFGQYTSTIKTIGQTTGANLRTIRNWHDGLKVPSSLHFVQLLQASPTLRKWFLSYLFGEDFWDDYKLIKGLGHSSLKSTKTQPREVKNTQNCEPINDPINLNERQKWFLMQLKSDQNIGAEDIVRRFALSLSSAKRDIADLKDKRIIRFQGSRKTGCYEIL